MAAPTPEELLRETIENLRITSASTTASNIITKFSGNAKHFRTWINSVERATIVARGQEDGDESVRNALASSEGVVADFIVRYIQKKKQLKAEIKWSELRTELNKRFGEQVDKHTLLVQLRKLKQRTNQNEMVFAEVLTSKAREIYGDDIENPFVQHDLVQIFVMGLINSQIASKILRQLPATLAEAMTIATEEAVVQNRLVSHGRLDEAMDTSVVSSSKMSTAGQKATRGQGKIVCYYCSKVGHKMFDCRKRKREQGQGQGLSQTVPTSMPRQSGQSGNMRQNRPKTCFACGRVGHLKFQCWHANPHLRPKQDQTRSSNQNVRRNNEVGGQDNPTLNE
jgi:hypothetical protein